MEEHEIHDMAGAELMARSRLQAVVRARNRRPSVDHVHSVSRGPAPDGIESGFAPLKSPTPEVIEELSRMQRLRLRLRDGQHGATR